MEALKKQHDEGRRMRELYRYFRPSSQSDLSSTSKLVCENSADVPSTTVSPPDGASERTAAQDFLVLGNPNKTLSSFAQLAAAQLNAERALISVSDRESRFILAEATQTHNADRSAKRGDGVWTGRSILDTAWSLCEATVNLSPSNKSPQGSFLVIDDLSKDERFSHLPFVDGEPNFRFYAGTPLTTANGINLGCFFVLDQQPRNGLADFEKESLGSLATLVIDYLKVSRQAEEGRRATRLSLGLSYFIEGSSSFADTAKSPHPTSLPPPSPSPSRHPRSSQSVGSRNSSDMPTWHSVNTNARSISPTRNPKFDSLPPEPMTAPPDWWPGKRGAALDESGGNSWAFRRAANLLRESLELDAGDGVIFVESGHGPLVELESGSDSGTDLGNPARVLAISTGDDPFAQLGSRTLYPSANIGTDFLHQLLRRYSKGKLWSFHRDGMLSSSDDDRPCSVRKQIDPTKPRTKSWKNVENAMLNRYFPGASQVLFVPLWNAASSQWFGGCFCWNTVETHVFSPSVELSSVLGFGTSIMAECSRLESLMSDRQKGDFIGSISHELRSPLHGIMAAAEFLGSTTLDDFQGSLLDTVNACGRTLLDTMNQVLDYSKIVSLEKRGRHSKRLKEPEKPSEKPHLDAPIPFDLAALTEEVVEGVCLGHEYGQRSANSTDQMVTLSQNTDSQSNTPTRPEVEVSIDIARNDWVYQTQPGALRRIIMNVFGNAMKYTDTGRVSIHLAKAENRLQRGEDLVTLTVSDTGRGMSEEFLDGRLYLPFAQEDSLAAGTGLGLSIVRSLVKALHGAINVQSRPGGGTIVKISLPLARPTAENSGSPSQELSKPPAPKPNLEGARVAILGTGTPGHWDVIAHYLTKWYGLELVSWPSPDPVDILLTDERELGTNPPTSSTTLPPLLILCNTSADHETLKSTWSSQATSVDIIRQPCGPHKLRKYISRILAELRKNQPLPKLTTSLPTRARNTSISLSLAPAPGNDTPSEPKPAPKPDPNSNPNPPSTTTTTAPRILLVDDNTINLNLLHTYLKKHPCPKSALSTATNGSLAVDAVQNNPTGYDLIFMDISMPVMDGFEATRAIRAIEDDRGGDRSTIVALTGLSSPRDEKEALESGVDLFLTKPVSFKEVGRILEGRRGDVVD